MQRENKANLFPYGSKPIMSGTFTNANPAALPWGLSNLPPEYRVDCLISSQRDRSERGSVARPRSHSY